MILKKPTVKDLFQFFRDIPANFAGSIREFSHFSSIAGASMLLAVSIVLSIFVMIPISPTLKMGIAYLATAMLGMIFGPVLGGLTAGLGDLIKFLLKPDGIFFPGFTLNAILGGVIYGLFFYKNRVSLSRCIAAKVSVNLFLNILLNTYWLSILYGDAYLVLLVSRLWKNIVLLPFEVTLLFVVLRTVSALLPRVNTRYVRMPEAKERRRKKIQP